MTNLKLQKATLRDFEIASVDLCMNDLQEFHAVAPNRDPARVIPGYLDETSMVIKAGALVVAVGGSKDCLWFVTTNVVDMLSKAERREFLKLLKEHLAAIPEDFQTFTNFVSVDNKPHIRLLEHLGATFSKEIKMSRAGFAFRQFWL